MWGLRHHPPLGQLAGAAQPLQRQERLDADPGRAGVPQQLHGDVFRLLAGRGAQEGAQEVSMDFEERGLRVSECTPSMLPSI